jgi:hypothetical protein
MLLPSKAKAVGSPGHVQDPCSSPCALACSATVACLPREPSQYPTELLWSKQGMTSLGAALAPPTCG